jgi:cation:H+ antiporter
VDITTLGFLVAGLVLLALGGEILVRSASKLAVAVGVSPLVVGLTVVAFGTSSPELAVSVQAGLAGNPGIALANVVGSNIFNVLFVLGLCALIVPLGVAQQLVRIEVPLLITLSVLLLLLSLDDRLSWLDGALLFALLVSYTVWAIRKSRRESAAVQDEYAHEYGPDRVKTGFGVAKQVMLIVISLAILVVGARWLIDGAVALARTIGVSDVVIGLTVVAAGTSLPEVATSVIATVRGERDIAVGNALGSSIFNILAIIGISSIITPGGLTVAPAMISFDMPVMIAVAVACLPIFFTGYEIARWEGALFLGYYIAYTAFLILAATHHDALPAFSHLMAVFVLPLTAVVLLAMVARALRASG